MRPLEVNPLSSVSTVIAIIKAYATKLSSRDSQRQYCSVRTPAALLVSDGVKYFTAKSLAAHGIHLPHHYAFAG